VDNEVTAVFYNGADVTGTSVTGDRTDVQTPKTLTFVDVPHATIEILGEEDDPAPGSGDLESGLLMFCVGGTWDGFVSNTGALVQTFGSSTAFDIDAARAALLSDPTTATSAFTLDGCTGCTKIWPSNSEK
jgi:hypothetical protein